MRKSLRYRQVYNALRGRILTGDYDPGSQLATEPELAEEFGVGLNTVRRAQALLIEEGLLDKQQGRGTFVPGDVARRRRLLFVCGQRLGDGLRGGHVTGYVGNLIVFSREQALARGMGFDTVWLPRAEPERVAPYCEAPAILENWGYVFTGAGVDHPLLGRVRELGLRHVTISPFTPDHNAVRLDLAQASRLALDEFRETGPPTIIGLDGEAHWTEPIVQERGLDCRREYLGTHVPTEPFETIGYRLANRLVAEGVDLSRLLVLDDVLARGVTRSLLRHGYGQRALQLVVLAGEQEIVPLGLPVTYVVHDTHQEVRQAFAILDQQRGRGESVPCRLSGYRVRRNVDVDAEGL